MKPSELYQREPEKVVTEFIEYGYLYGCYYNHIPEIDQYAKYKATDRIKIHIYKEFWFDSRRFWRLASIWLDDKPVMITQNAGREGDDHARRIITDRDRYIELVALLMSLQCPQPNDIEDVADPETDLDDLTSFYGDHLDGFFERYNY
jgi:hypothetical protein